MRYMLQYGFHDFIFTTPLYWYSDQYPGKILYTDTLLIIQTDTANTFKTFIWYKYQSSYQYPFWYRYIKIYIPCNGIGTRLIADSISESVPYQLQSPYRYRYYANKIYRSDNYNSIGHITNLWYRWNAKYQIPHKIYTYKALFIVFMSPCLRVSMWSQHGVTWRTWSHLT